MFRRAWPSPWRPSMSSSSGMASNPMPRVSCRSRSLSLVCRIPISLLGLSETNTIGYKAIIRQSLYPDGTYDEPIQLARARKAISDYKKATKNACGTLELMVYYVECGTQCSVDFGDIDAWFYESLESMFRQVIQTLQHSDHDTLDRFLPRLDAIVRQARGIGWGYYDGLSATLKAAFPRGS